ncbi:MAG TPA: GNAT family N-acetyltransferase [Vicinamibacterales bacterium]|nr:GNAT family N-acetyltransferase [Vicinamibacterales bacterium]
MGVKGGDGVLKLYEIDPVRDPRWLDLIQRSDASSIFHTPGWLETLRRTYEYEPVAFTDSAPGTPLNNGLLFCRVSSWLTGRRLVSLPFSDHCAPLVESPEALKAMLESLKAEIGREGRYIELRPLSPLTVAEGFERAAEYCLHTIDLRPELDGVFAAFHKSHIQRTIRKAERSGLSCEVGNSATLIREFYALHELTRFKHGAPIQPLSWFQNLADSLGDRMKVYVARVEGKPAAAILTSLHRTTLVYKYGCSDAAYNRYGGTPLLFWNAIKDAKANGVVAFDLGRSDLDNEGLLAFKDHLGGQRTALNYYRFSGKPAQASATRWKPAIAKHVFSLVPKTFQARVGSGLYRHFG